MSRKALVLVPIAWALASGTAAAGLASPAHRVSGAIPHERVGEMRSFSFQLLAAVNRVRSAKGLRELRLNGALAHAARSHSASMAKHGYFEHTGWDGVDFWQRIKAMYKPPRVGTWAVGENLAWASPDLTVDQAIAMWLRSPRHRKNMLDPTWREIGFGCAHAAAAPGVYEGMDVTILTADFGARSAA